MLVGYVIAGLVLLLILVAAYRALGRPSAPVSDPRRLLSAVLDAATGALDSMQKPAVPRGPSVQRQLEGCAQALERLDPSGLDPAAAAARDALTGGVSELIWAARIEERSGLASEGLRRAHAELHESGAGALQRARLALAESPFAKERDGAG